MLGFTTFSGSTFASVGAGAIIRKEVRFVCEAMLNVNANADWNVGASILGEAYLQGKGGIAGSGWVRQNPEGEEWDYQQSSDWNKIN